MEYTEQDRENHYTNKTPQEDCLVCLVGNVNSHGLGLNPQMIEDLGERWWTIENLSRGMNASMVLMRMADAEQ